MAKKKARPEFKLPSTKPGSTPPASSEWVYRSGADPGEVPEAPVPAAVMAEAPIPDRLAGARTIVNTYATAATAAGFIPWPLIDMIALGGLQLAMISALSAHYHVPFSRARGKALLAALLTGVASRKLGQSLCASIVKFVPGVGPLAAKLAIPGMGSALTYAVGTVFVEHFEAGGTLVDFDATNKITYGPPRHRDTEIKVS